MNHKKVISLMCLMSVYVFPVSDNVRNLLVAAAPVAVYEVGARAINPTQRMTKKSRVAEAAAAMAALYAMYAQNQGNSKVAVISGTASAAITAGGLFCRYKRNLASTKPVTQVNKARLIRYKRNLAPTERVTQANNAPQGVESAQLGYF